MAAIINHTVLTAYFKNIATHLVGINDFFRMDLTEIQGAFRSTATFPCLVIEAHEGDYGDSNTMQTVNNRTFAFTVYTKPQTGDYEDQDNCLNISETLGKKILARMRHDAKTPEHFLHNNFKVEECSYAKVGPIFNERLYGYRFIGNISAHEPLIVNPLDWTDVPVVCQ